MHRKPRCLADLLGKLADLRRRAREDRHAHPFPLLVVLCVSAALTPLVVTPATMWSMGSVVVLPGFVLVVGGLVGLRRDPPPGGGT